MSKKFGLGKGLNALIPEDTVILEPKKGKDKNDDKGYSLIDINLIKSNESQPRKLFDDEKIMEIAESIKSNGIIQPLILRIDKDEYIDIYLNTVNATFADECIKEWLRRLI